MPFGLANAPGIFHELMSVDLHGLRDFALSYLDDKIIFSASEEHKHIQRELYKKGLCYGGLTKPLL